MKHLPLPVGTAEDMPGAEYGTWWHRLWVGWQTGHELSANLWTLNGKRYGKFWVRDGALVYVESNAWKGKRGKGLIELSAKAGWATIQSLVLEQEGGFWLDNGVQTRTFKSGCKGIRDTAWQAAELLARYLWDHWAPDKCEGFTRFLDGEPRGATYIHYEPHVNEFIASLPITQRREWGNAILGAMASKLRDPVEWPRWRRFLRPGYAGLRPLPVDSSKPRGRKHPSSAVMLLGADLGWLDPEGPVYRLL